jgi:hypothetical protein
MLLRHTHRIETHFKVSSGSVDPSSIFASLVDVLAISSSAFCSASDSSVFFSAAADLEAGAAFFLDS